MDIEFEREGTFASRQSEKGGGKIALPWRGSRMSEDSGKSLGVFDEGGKSKFGIF